MQTFSSDHAWNKISGFLLLSFFIFFAVLFLLLVSFFFIFAVRSVLLEH